MKPLYVAIVALSLLSFTAPAEAQLNAKGKITLLRVHDLDTGYGPPSDRINTEAVIWLDTKPGFAFGFQLRNDTKLPARQGMLDLLRDAFEHNWIVNIDYNISPGKKNGVVLRVWLTK